MPEKENSAAVLRDVYGRWGFFVTETLSFFVNGPVLSVVVLVGHRFCRAPFSWSGCSPRRPIGEIGFVN